MSEVEPRLAVLEARLLLLLRAMRNEFAQAPIGTFDRRWDEVDPSTPANDRPIFTP